MAVHVHKELCKGCGLCITLCPKKVFEVSDEVNKKGFNVITPARQEDCIKCRLCEKSCPDLAIVVDEE